MKYYFVRHTSVNIPKGICYGQSDVPVSQSFLEEAEKVKQQLSSVSLNHIYSSPLTRCKKLAQFCTDKLPIHYDNRLKEMNYGLWELQSWNSIDFTEWEKDWVYTPVPQGESFYDEYKRLVSFIADLDERHSETDHIAIFTHGGILACAHAYFNAIPLEKAFDNKAAYGTIFTFES